jgi:hypothetical protein
MGVARGTCTRDMVFLLNALKNEDLFKPMEWDIPSKNKEEEAAGIRKMIQEQGVS